MENIDNYILEFDKYSLMKQHERILKKPSFIGVGAGRCGTTSLYSYLRNHPEVYMSPVKEINYFGFRDKETNPYGLSINEYYNYFLGAGSKKVIGEISPAYLALDNSAQLIHKYIGTCKIIITLREPWSRTLSQFKHHYDKHGYTDINQYLRQGLKAFYEKPYSAYRFNWFHPVKNISQSLYYEDIKKYVDTFGRENVHFILYDSIRKDEVGVLLKLSEFLNIENLSTPLPVTNTSKKSRANVLNVDKKVMSELSKLFLKDIESIISSFDLPIEEWLEFI